MARTGRSQVLTTPPVEGCMVSKPRFGTAKKRVKSEEEIQKIFVPRVSVVRAIKRCKIYAGGSLVHCALHVADGKRLARC